MTDHGTYLSVEAGETDLDKLIETVRHERRPVQILKNGTPVAHLAPAPASGRRQLAADPSLRVQLNVEGHELTTEADWPAHPLAGGRDATGMAR